MYTDNRVVEAWDGGVGVAISGQWEKKGMCI